MAAYTRTRTFICCVEIKLDVRIVFVCTVQCACTKNIRFVVVVWLAKMRHEKNKKCRDWVFSIWSVSLLEKARFPIRTYKFSPNHFGHKFELKIKSISLNKILNIKHRTQTQASVRQDDNRRHRKFVHKLFKRNSQTNQLRSTYIPPSESIVEHICRLSIFWNFNWSFDLSTNVQSIRAIFNTSLDFFFFRWRWQSQHRISQWFRPFFFFFLILCLSSVFFWSFVLCFITAVVFPIL